MGASCGLEAFGLMIRRLASVSPKPKCSRVPIPNAARRKVGVQANGSDPPDTETVAPGAAATAPSKTPFTTRSPGAANYIYVGRAVAQAPVATFASRPTLTAFATMPAVTSDELVSFSLARMGG